MWLLALTLISLLSVHAIDIANEFVDEDADAVVVEAEDEVSMSRQSRQLEEVDNLLYNQLGLSPLLAPPLDQPCLTKDSGLGKCMSLKACYPYFKIPEFNTLDTWVMGLYDTCSYQSPQGRQVFGVCCNNTAPLEIPEDIPTQTVDDTDDVDAIVDEFPLEDATRSNCGFRNIRPEITLYRPLPYIVNGYEAIKHEYPFMAALMNRQRQFCGGSLIDDNHILTAAHCVAHMSKYDVQNLRVRLGDHNIKTNSEANHVEKRVKRVIRHKGFSSSTLWNDVAILTLEDDVQYTSNIQPICLAQGRKKYVGNTVTVAGWGTLREGGSQPASLMKVDVKVWENSRCKESYGSSAPGGITSHMLCASESDRDSCSGDSGGPLFDCPYNGSCEQIGIVSWGIGCAKQQYPGVYTRVTEMMPWIKRIIAEY